MNVSLTQKESEILLWFCNRANSNKRACDLLDISPGDLARELNIDASNLNKYIQSLKRKGVIESGFRVSLEYRKIQCSKS